MTRPDRLAHAIELIDTAHAEDPNKHTLPSGESIPYELHYARKMTSYLSAHSADASTSVQLACRAQHFRRWEVPRSNYPMTKAGYMLWRGGLKKRQAELVEQLLREDCAGDWSEDEISSVGALIRKEGLKKGEGNGDADAQILEDVACLVFLDDQFQAFAKGHDDEKVIDILRKTWVKMGKRGQDLALQMELPDEAKALVQKALAN